MHHAHRGCHIEHAPSFGSATHLRVHEKLFLPARAVYESFHGVAAGYGLELHKAASNVLLLEVNLAPKAFVEIGRGAKGEGLIRTATETIPCPQIFGSPAHCDLPILRYIEKVYRSRALLDPAIDEPVDVDLFAVLRGRRRRLREGYVSKSTQPESSSSKFIGEKETASVGVSP